VHFFQFPKVVFPLPRNPAIKATVPQMSKQKADFSKTSYFLNLTFTDFGKTLVSVIDISDNQFHLLLSNQWLFYPLSYH
jgi:hypothetical protein